MQEMQAKLAHGLSRLGLLMRHLAWRESYQRGLSPTQAQILSLLQVSGGRLRVGEVAELLALRAATASDSISALEEKGLVRREHDPADKRAVNVVLTRRGEGAVAGSSLGLEGLVRVVDRLSDQEKDLLLRLITKLIAELQLEGLIPVQRMCLGCRYFRPNRFPGSDRPHYCAFVEAPMADRELRLVCPDHHPVEKLELAALLERFGVRATGHSEGPAQINP